MAKANPLQRSNIAVLFFGVVFGFIFAVLMLSSSNQNDALENSIHHGNLHIDRDLFEFIDKNLLKGHENGSLAEKLYKEVRVLCWVMTHPGNHKSKAIHVQKTWGKRCNKLIFMSSKNDSEINAIALSVGEGRDNLWGKTKEAFKYVYQNHFNDADWFMKADDDTYILMDNLRYMLYPYSPYQSIYFGCKMAPFVKQGYMSGGAGYVLSKEALKRFVDKGLSDSKIRCDEAKRDEDIEMGICMEKLNVTAGDSRDIYGRETFFPFKPEDLNYINERKKDFYYNISDGISNCCSKNAISFHYITPNQMYVLEYLAYYFKVFGTKPSDKLPKKHNFKFGDESSHTSNDFSSSTLLPLS